MQRRREPGQPDAVRGERHLRAGIERGRARDDAGQATPQQRLATGEADFTDAEHGHGDPHQPDDLVVAQHSLPGQPVQAFRWHAVRTAEVAAVGQRYPQVGRDASERVREHGRHLTRHRLLVLGYLS